MELLAPRKWSASDITLLKAGSALFGVAVGLTMPKRCRPFAPLILLGVAALAARPILHYFRAEEEEELPLDERTPAGENL